METPDYTAIHLNTANRNLPNLRQDTRERLANFVRDAPATGRHTLVTEAIIAKEIQPGLSAENLILKAVRVAVWSAVYFPKQFIPYYVFLSWGLSQKITKDSPQVEQFIKANRKMKENVDNLGWVAVGYTTQRATTDPTTVDGFRLTVDGDDYFERVNCKNSKKVSRALQTHAADLTDTRICPEDVANPMYREQIEKDKEILTDLKKSGVIAHFASSSSPAFLRLTGKKA
jgi:hypothetical protein